MINKRENNIRNFAYKAIAIKDGVIVLFESFSKCDHSDVKINYFNGELYIELGSNVFLLTKHMINKLLETPVIYIATGSFESYEALDFEFILDVDKDVLAQIKGAVAILDSKLQENELKINETIQETIVV